MRYRFVVDWCEYRKGDAVPTDLLGPGVVATLLEYKRIERVESAAPAEKALRNPPADKAMRKAPKTK